MEKMSRKLNKRDRPRRLRTVWKRVVGAMAVIVVFCTVYALVLPAITLSENPNCGQQVHTHGDGCYRTQIVVPECAAAAHIHDETCEDSLQNPACGFGERILHSHAENCYDRSGILICQLPELQEHIHDATCGSTERKLICTLEELPEHAHTEECYEREMVLICQEAEQQSHLHTEECYSYGEELSCNQEHDHSPECYERLLLCTCEELMLHNHIDSCYELQEKLVCMEGQQGHIHNDTCYETVTNLSCQQEQVAEHLHTPSCYDEAGQRCCGMLSGVIHVHDDTCFKQIILDEPELICSLPEHTHVDSCYLDAADCPPVQKEFYCGLGLHQHNADCYDTTGALVCTIPVHTHDVSCKVPDYDPEADVETAADWEATVKDVALTGKWPADLLNVAATQLGYRESKRNVLWLEDGSVKGYTRYGAWYGAPYIDWSAAFVAFCVEYANISGLPQESSCEEYYSMLDTMGLLREPMNYLPKPGDLALLDVDAEDGEVKANRMGIVSELLLNDAGEIATIKLLVGDAEGAVKYLTYDLLSSMILGYGDVPTGDRRVLICQQEHEHTDDCYYFKLDYCDDLLQGQLLIGGIKELPEDVTLQIAPVTSANDPAGYSSMIASLSTHMQQSPYYLGNASFYQMQLLLDGERYQLPQGAKITVEVSFRAPVFTPEALEGAAKVETYQFMQTNPQNGNLLSGLVSAEMSQAQSAGLVNAVDDETIDVEQPLELYRVEQVDEDTYENASDGLTGIGFESDMVTTFAVVLSNTTKTGQFWERIFDSSEIVSGGTYMIVSAEGNYALRGDNTNNYTAVTIQAQKGEEKPDAAWDQNPERNTRYYTITKTDGSAVDNYLYWTFTAGANQYTVRNQGTSNYLRLNSNLIAGQSANLTLTYKLPEQGWWFANGNNYLRNKGTGKFEFGAGNDGSYTSNGANVAYYYSRDMMVFKLSDVTALEIPDDVIYESGSTEVTMTLVTDASELKVGDTIVIAALDYNYALSTTQNTNNRGQASITKTGSTCTYSDSTQRITLVSGTTSGTFGFKVDNQYLYASASSYAWTDQMKTTSTLNANGSWSVSIDSTGAAAIKASGNSSRPWMRYNASSGVFCCYSSSSSNSAICIYKEVAIVQGPEKPDYGEFITVSGGLEGETALEKDSITVEGQYFSDPATSDIETQFRQDSYEASKVIDGKVVTDKSVVYGADDYDAFAHYDPNTFSVALSALGQEYEIPYEHQVRTPVDVVFVLDVSGSMTSNSTTQGENPNRVVDLCKAVNAAMSQIMEDHEANRVGISIYSSGAWELLPLDRYTANNGEYLVTQQKSFKHNPTNYSFTINYLLGSSSLRDSKGNSYANVGSSAVQGIGTYTQAGIAMGNEIFEAVEDDTLYTTTLGEGEMERTYTVKRQPVMILVSDGEPTHSTSIYNDVLKGPHYGSGNSDPSSNGKGIHGYYTVLSANYYKRAVSIQYNKEAMFYTIGMGIHETQDGPLVSTGKTGDNYKRAVLNPTMDIIQSLTSNISKANTTDQLKNMLLSTYTGSTVQVRYDWPEQWYGTPHTYEPVLQPNPYANDFEYADGAYFGDLPESELKKIFQDIYASSMTYNTYGFVLYRNSSVDILDNIGEGMEVKGAPVLRYAGVNHTASQINQNGNVTAYVYEGIYTDPYIPDREVDLSHISVTVTTNADGTQMVEMYIMDAALPTYTPELVGREYYYEQLPVRLIYQVGLTEEAQEQVLALNRTGGELVFYTNQWQDGEGNEAWDRLSTSVLLPSTENPFYYHIDGTEAPYKPHHSLKSDDTTHTVDYHVDCHREIEEKNGEVLVKVIHKQGNNGKLVFKADTVSIPVEKQWGSGIHSDIMNPVEMVVYKITETVDSIGVVIRNAEPVTTLTLSAQNNWQNIAQGLPAPDGNWYYAIAETVPPGYTATYERPTVSITVDGSTFFDAVIFDGSEDVITVTNTVAVRLPATGGVGTLWYTVGGLLLITAALLLYNTQRKRRREEMLSP